MIRHFPSATTISLPEQFTDPFRYFPHPLVRQAAGLLMQEIEGRSDMKAWFSEGKMMGILLVSLPGSDDIGYLAAFSGNAGGKSIIDGFVPPIFDLLDPSGYFKTREAEISALNKQISSLEDIGNLSGLKLLLAEAEAERKEEISRQKAVMAISKKERDEIRMEVSDPSRLEELIRESQFEKAELRRLKTSWEDKIRAIRNEIDALTSEISELKSIRARMSDDLQTWIFGQYIVHNALGEEKSIHDIFAGEGLIPPGGTGECAAPKLLEYAYRNGLRPLAMGEFWYGKSPETAVRTHGHFYPSCTSKCGPLLKFMMKGLTSGSRTTCDDNIRIIFEDASIIAVDKPSGMPSVPGLDGRTSVQEKLVLSHGDIYPVHRLDMDTSGILIFARTQEAAVGLQRQFEAHSVIKTYHARLSASEEGMRFMPGDHGTICLPLCPDHDERPRQKADKTQGKPSETSYEVISVNDDSTIDIVFHPLTGRTHQLRVHSAHTLGLGHPIKGDMLYGGSPADRLNLHASSIIFLHPADGSTVHLKSDFNMFK